MAKITTRDASIRLGITPTRVQQLILDGKLAAEKFGRDWMIEEKDLAAVKTYGKSGRPPKDAQAPAPAKKARVKKGSK